MHKYQAGYNFKKEKQEKKINPINAQKNKWSFKQIDMQTSLFNKKNMLDKQEQSMRENKDRKSLGNIPLEALI